MGFTYYGHSCKMGRSKQNFTCLSLNVAKFEIAKSSHVVKNNGTVLSNFPFFTRVLILTEIFLKSAVRISFTQRTRSSVHVTSDEKTFVSESKE